MTPFVKGHGDSRFLLSDTYIHTATAHNLWLQFGVDEHAVATYFDVHEGYRVLTHSHVAKHANSSVFFDAFCFMGKKGVDC